MASVRKVAWTHKAVTKQAWQVTYTDPATKKRPTKNFAAKKTADAYRLKVEREIEDGVHTAAARSKTVGEACAAYIKNAEERFADGRIGQSRLGLIRLTLTRDMAPFLGGILIADLTAAMVEEHYSALLKLRSISPPVLKARFIILKQVEDFARRREWTSKSVVPLAMQSLRGLERREPRRYSPDQVLDLLRVVAKRRRRTTERARQHLRCFVTVAAFCGLRWGEISALREEDIRFDEGVIRVQHSLTQWDVLGPTKTRAGNREVPMPGNVADVLREWLATSVIKDERGLIFRNRKGGFLAQANFRFTYWLPLLQEAGLAAENGDEAFRFHSLRSFAGSWWVDNGVPITTVAKWLGHSKPDMTLEFYARSLRSQADQREAADKMATRLLARGTVALIDAAPILYTTRTRQQRVSAKKISSSNALELQL